MHDLALALGGMTVQELRWRMPLDELKRWRMYEEEFGPFNLAMRIERVVGLSAAPHLKGHPFKKLAPWPAVRQVVNGIDEAFGILMTTAAARRRAIGKS